MNTKEVARTVLTVEFDHDPGETPETLQNDVFEALQNVPGHVATELQYTRRMLVRVPDESEVK